MGAPLELGRGDAPLYSAQSNTAAGNEWFHGAPEAVWGGRDTSAAGVHGIFGRERGMARVVPTS